MKIYEATEAAYKNGYSKGYEDGKKDAEKPAQQQNINKTLYWSVATKNVICVVCWVILAIAFNKWWIALFGALFLTSVNTKKQYCRTCDGCGRHSEYADTRSEALCKAKEAGWIHNAEKDKDYCPNCKIEF
jgi:hypothetical protein